MHRILALVATIPLAACAAGQPVPRPPLFPMSAAWKTLFEDFVQPPLAADTRRAYVATRDGVVRALDLTTGAVSWKAEGLPGVLAAGDGYVLVRAADGGLASLQPRTGAVRWKATTGVEGLLPALVDGDRVLVAGKGLAAVELASGRVLWTERSGAEITAPPAPAGARVLTGESDGVLRCRRREDGVPVWQYRTATPLEAPPLVDLARRKAYLATTDQRIVELSLDDGDDGWRWRVGADVTHRGLLLPEQVLFAGQDAVLWSLRRGGNLAWRGALPSRPLSGPLLVGEHVLVACLENELVGFTPDTGRPAGALRTPAEIRTPPLVAGSLVLVGLRDRSVIAYALPGSAPAVAPAPAEPAPAPVAPPAGGR